MDWIKRNRGINLSSVVTNGLPTLGVGKYTGYLGAKSIDSEGLQWICVSTSQGSHFEQSDLDCDLEPNADIEFEIGIRDGAVAHLKGNLYQLVYDDKELTGWLPLNELYDYIQANNIQLAEPKLIWIRPKEKQ